MLFVPTDHHIVASDSRVRIKGDLKRLHAPSMAITLANSTLYTLPISRDLKVGQALGHLVLIDNGNSFVEFTGRLDIDRLTLRNVMHFNCTTDVGLRETDFAFDSRLDVITTTCREGLYVDSR